MHFETINFFSNIHKITGHKQFYGGLSYDEDSIKTVLGGQAHDHTRELGEIIEKDMSQYKMTEAKLNILELLKNGHSAVIAGQQAGLFMSPSYIIHKIISILVVTKEIKEKHDYDAVPVFWIAGEDHDFDEVNHTHVYDAYYKRRV